MNSRIKKLFVNSARTKTNIFWGAGSIFDIYGAFFRAPKQKVFVSYKSDEDAIKSDFYMIGQDVNNAFKKQLDDTKDLKINESTRRKLEELSIG